MRIAGARVLVTGGCGLIGSTTVDRLLERDAGAVVILDNLDRGSTANIDHLSGDPRVTLVRGDIRDRDTVERVTAGMDAVFHMAALRITACAANPRAALEVMCDGAFNVVEAARQAGVKKVIAASTASVYGLAEEFPTSERHHPYGNRTWYGAAKTMLEGLLRSCHESHGLDYVALRYFNVYGPRMDTHGRYTEVLVRWMERIDLGQPPLIFGSGTETLDFVYVDDVARANVAALESDASDEVFNVASGVETSLHELACALLRAMDASLEPVHGPPRDVNPVPRRCGDPSKAATQLGFHVSVPLDEGLRRLVAWWRSTRQPPAS